jgi:hypothetical protein
MMKCDSAQNRVDARGRNSPPQKIEAGCGSLGYRVMEGNNSGRGSPAPFTAHYYVKYHDEGTTTREALLELSLAQRWLPNLI